MNILIEIGHPAHVHFFRRTIARLGENGHRVVLVTRDKDITNRLLDRFGLPYRTLSKPTGKGKLTLAVELTKRWAQIIRIIRQEKIDVAASIAGISTSFPAWLCRIPNVAFADTEDAHLQNRIAYPFADAVYTPEYYLRDFGKQVRYPGLHELSYLQDFDFAAAAETRRQLGLPEKYFVLRMVANQALHDQDIAGLSEENMLELVRYCETMGQVFVTSEAALPPSLQKYGIRFPIEVVHAVLGGATAFIGESPTMAVESSLLGTPALLVSNRVRRLGNMVGLEARHSLLLNFLNWDELHRYLQTAPNFAQLKTAWTERAARYRTQTPPMEAFLLKAIEGAPNVCAA